MKKKLVASLAAAMVLGVAGTSFAATNPFTDVPAKHWSYDAVTKLANAGIVDGYGDGTFKGDKTISRYEMAQIVAKAMAHSDKATAEQKASIDKLSVEFADELEGLNVRVTKLEKNSSTIKVTGEARLRYENFNRAYDAATDTVGGLNSLKLRTRVHLDGQINNEWSYYGRLQSVNNLRGETGDDKVTMDNAYVKGQVLGTTATIGRFDYFLNNGLMIDSTLNGVNFEMGNVLKANVFYGKENNKDVWGNVSDVTGMTYVEVTGVGLKYAASKATSLNGGYYQFKDKDHNGILSAMTGNSSDKANVWEAGFKSQLTSDWSLTGSYGASDADDENKAYYAEFGYKGADKKKVGSYGAWVNYRHLEALAAPKTTFDGPYAYNFQLAGGKGYEIGFNYTPVLNTVLRVKYADLKPTTDGESDKTKFYQAQVEFFF
ncbi:UFO1_4202 family uranium-binding S-layer protein [Pelosinus propionicus]|uniref:S-layer homology domain-containing protein n=1 Tax=Pelosinus propionicus DSM 13327 TaxID=1123291 RepID=A0A1I4MR35_9FIRM|nr:S-layer homology domain-containing protein [Pelosinus propionicus]SFM05537.1 S-layer homology domain-containing protein [Pelosinus propionicus DSM 13327]